MYAVRPKTRRTREQKLRPVLVCKRICKSVNVLATEAGGAEEYSFLTPVLEENERPTSRSGRFTPSERTLVSNELAAGWAPEAVQTAGEENMIGNVLYV